MAMYSKIGNLIWKEMRLQGYSQVQLVEKLQMPNLRLSRIFTQERIEAELLIHISKVLGKDFFQVLDPGELKQLLKLKVQADPNFKIEELEAQIKDLQTSIQCSQENKDNSL